MKRSLIASSVSLALLAGCSTATYEHKPQLGGAKEPLFTTYKDDYLVRDQMLINNNKQRSEVALLRRQLGQLQARLAQLTEMENQLAHKIQQSKYETESEPTSEKGDQRIAEFQAATRNSQQELAATRIHHEQVTAEIDADLESKLAQLEVEAESLMSNIKNDLRLRKARLKAAAITQKAAASSQLVQGDSKVVAPVLTADKVYSYSEPAPSESPEASDDKKKIVSSRRLKTEAKAIANAQKQVEPIVAVSAVSGHINIKPIISPRRKTRTAYDVVYSYNDRDSWRRFEALLKAHGVKDVWAVHSRKQNSYFIYVGHYHRKSDAMRRKAYLAKVLHTDHAKVKTSRVVI